MSVALLDWRGQLDLDWGAREDLCLPVAALSRVGRGEAVEHGALTLNDLITGAWDDLSVGRTVSCPACGGRMASPANPRQDAWGGDCMDCGARLS
jgi:hypothetical protein